MYCLAKVNYWDFVLGVHYSEGHRKESFYKNLKKLGFLQALQVEYWTQTQSFEIWGSHGSADEATCLLGHDSLLTATDILDKPATSAFLLLLCQ